MQNHDIFKPKAEPVIGDNYWIIREGCYVKDAQTGKRFSGNEAARVTANQAGWEDGVPTFHYIVENPHKDIPAVISRVGRNFLDVVDCVGD